MDKKLSLMNKARELKAKQALFIDIEKIKFSESYRIQCEQNACGFYNKNWMCPPAIGSISDLMKKVLDYKQGFLIQTVHPLEDAFDWESMLEGQAAHEKIFRELLHYIEKECQFKSILPLSAGPCQYCKKCAYLEGKSCCFPEKAVSSVEAYGIDVASLLKEYQIPYVNGENTVSYVGLILFKQQ